MTNPEDAERFEAARRLGGLTTQQLWTRYLALGGRDDVFDVDAFLHGLRPMKPIEHDVLAQALNERLGETFDAARVHYVDPELDRPRRCADPAEVLSHLLDGEENRPSNRDPDA